MITHRENSFIFFSVCITLFFFASNSILCRLALIENSIDAYSFTFIRLFSGAVVLAFLFYLKEGFINIEFHTNWPSSFMLFSYALCFSYAYINLDAGLGALILFAMVQLTIFSSALFAKEKIGFQKILGMIIAFGGLCYLLYPNEEYNLSNFHVTLMIIPGISWGLYTVMGKTSKNALQHTMDNFLKSIIFITLLFFIFIDSIFMNFQGLILATLSGAITSGLGYALWYYLLPQIKMTTSGVVQLLVPVIAIFLSVLLLDEQLTLTLIVSTVVIILGISISILANN